MQQLPFNNVTLVAGLLMLAIAAISLVISLLVPHEKRMKFLVFLLFFLVIYNIVLIVATIVLFLIFYQV